jgi:hypothetical protein
VTFYGSFDTLEIGGPASFARGDRATCLFILS